MDWIKDAWAGKQKLWQVFWFGFLLPQAFGFLIGFIKGFVRGYRKARGGASYMPDQGWLYDLHMPWSHPLWQLLGILYFVFLAVMVWKCRGNTNNKLWGYLAMGMVILALFGGIVVNIVSAWG